MYSTENDRQPLLVNVCNHLPKGDPSIMDMQDVYRTTNLVQQDYTKLFLGFSSWIAAFFLIWVIPIFKLLYVKASYGSHKNQRGHILLAKLFIPVIILYSIHKSWLYADVQLEPLPFDLNKDTGFAIIIISQGSSWAFQSISFLYTCVLFWKVCYLQILNIVNMIGWGLCLRSASKIAHLHRDIVNTASSMHASATFAALKNSSKLVDGDAITEISERIELCGHSQATLSMHASVASNNCSELVGRDANTEISERIELFFQSQAAWSSRAALVNFLSTSNAGISVYGFILDRFFVHTSLGALATTTWFVLGQSLTS